ncbi:MAG TPA: ABC transporter permease [Thermoanaerobaculia bacterium]|jgi:predicted permease
MALLRKASRRLRTLSHRGRFERDLEEELRFHLDMQTEKHVQEGMAPKEARALARRELGSADRFKDEVRDVRGVTWLDDLRRDVRFGLRSLRRSPGFTIVAMLCLALGIGANAALFSVLNAVLLRPLPYPEPDRLVRIYEKIGERGSGSVSVPNYRDWMAQSTGFEQLAAWLEGSRNLQGVGEAERITTVQATSNLFSTLRARPLLGRTFVPGQDEPGHGRVVVLSESLWRRRFGGDRSILGRALQLDGAPYSVIGVMPASFVFPPAREAAEAWVLYEPTPREERERGSHFLAVVGRLKARVGLEGATTQLKQVAARIEKAFPNDQTGRSVIVPPLRDSMIGERARTALVILLGAVFLVLLIACANVANLLLARAAVRQREVAVRLALGASRSRLVRQLLVESLLLATAGALLGLLLAASGLAVLTPLVQRALPLPAGIPLDGRVFLFLLAVALFSGLAFGIVPALQAARGEVRESLGEGGRTTSGGGQQRFRSGLVVAEIALSLVLLVGAGLLLRGFLKVSGTEPGFSPRGVLTAHLAVPAARGPEATPRIYRPLLERVRSLPEVRAAALISMLPIQEAWTNGGYTVAGRPAPPPGQDWVAELRLASPGFFGSLGIPILRGRDFEERDGEKGHKVAIVNEALVRQRFRDENPLGHRISVGDEITVEIVGVAGAVRQAGLDHEPLAEIYLPYGDADLTGLVSDMVLVVRAAGAPGPLAAAVRRAVRSVDPGLPLYRVRTMEQVISDSLALRRLNLWLLALFAGIALALSAAGLYGVISYLVAQRTREIGMRMALGAQARDVIALVMRQGSRLTAIGIVAGLLGALALTRWLESLLDGVSARDPFTFLGIAALLVAVALLASWLPARRAARVEPVIAIRSE